MVVLACSLCAPLLLIMLLGGLHCQPVLLDSYNISRYSEKVKMSTLIWLTPAACLFEAWVQKASNPSLADRSTTSVVVEVDPEDQENKTIFRAQRSYGVPRCNPIFLEPPSTNNFVYEVGPNIESLNGTTVLSVDGGKSYRVRFTLHSGTGVPLAVTNWSTPFQTRGIAASAQDLPVWLEGRSGGMVVITVILSLAMFLLLAGMGFAFGTSHQ